MGSLIGLKFHNALFFDLRGNYIGQKLIKISFKKGFSKQIFKYKSGTYNVNSYCSKSERLYFPYLFDYYDYYYIIGFPDPVNIKTNVIPQFNAEMYNIQLESKVLRDLNNVRKDLLSKLLSPQVLIILILIIGGIIYFLSGGSLTNPQQ